MIDARLKLSIFTSTPVATVETFTDQSEAAVDYGRDTFSVTLNTTDYLYIGYRKAFGATYCNLTSVSETATYFAGEYWNGSAWVALSTLRDLTRGMRRSGWFTWDRPSDWTSREVENVPAYWIRLVPGANTTSISVSGLNLVYADDYDLVTEFSKVLDASFIPDGETSHIRTHVAVRNQLTQDLRSRNYIKQNDEGEWLNLTPWDLHDVEEVRQAATYLALAKIFFNYSDDMNDHWMSKSKYYDNKYKGALDKLQVSTDKDDDGSESLDERVVVSVMRLMR